MSDFIVVPHTHTLIMKGDDVIVQALQFVRAGSFYPVDGELPKLESLTSDDHPILDYSD